VEFESLGIFETNSVSASLIALGAIHKENDVKIIGKQILGEGIVTFFVTGNLGALRNALKLGANAIISGNEFRGFHIIPLPHPKLFTTFSLEKK